MDFFNKENNILRLIQFGAIISTIIVSFVITQIFIKESQHSLKLDIKKIEENYLTLNKTVVENLVNKIYNIIELERKFQKEYFYLEIKKEVHQAYSIATAIYNENIKKANYSKEETIESIKSVLRAIRFKENGYLFIFEMNGKNILNGEFPDIENENLWEYQDLKGNFIFKDMNKLLSNTNETYYDWYWRKNKTDKREYHKIGFLKKFEPYDLYIGTGYYEDDYEEESKLIILKKLNSLKLKAPEHIFIYNLDGTCLVNPKKELIGTNRYDVQSEDGRFNLRDMINFSIENKEGFQRYISTVKLNDSLKSNDKISFVKLYENWNWMIGSGFYLEELNNRIIEKKEALKLSNKKTINYIILIAIVITFFMIIISFYLSKLINNIFFEYKKRIDLEMSNILEKEKLLMQQSKMATMGEMIGSIAHQWKQPLSLISLSNGLLKINNEIKDFSTPQEITNAIENIDNSAQLSQIKPNCFLV